MRPRTRTRRFLPLRLTDLETRVTPALSLHGPYTTGELGQLAATGGDAWQAHAALPAAPAGAKSYFDLDDFVPAKLDVARLRSHLAAAPQLFGADAGSSSVELALPKPDGSLARFRVWEYSVMEPGYIDPNPTFWAYRGQGIDDPHATVHADVSPLGFHAQVLSPEGAWYVDPYWHMQAVEHVSYFREDLNNTHGGGCTCTLCQAAVGQPTFSAGSLTAVSGTSLPTPGGGGSVTPFTLANAGTTRTYRLACAATGEYTADFGGTVANAETAIKAAVNRINQVYFNELSILFGLVTNNNSLIYTNASTDPYTDGDTGKMVDENQTTVDNMIGSANYDIGHVFGGAGGGGFAPGRVGVSGQKARGCTTAGTPTGEAFWIDFVAHEIGHQFNARHTFNSSGDNSQREADHAFEPGSGSTIMGYAGISGVNNVQANSNDYFHVASLDDIVTYVKSIPTVGTSTPNGNNGPGFGTGFNQVIPAGTPFFLSVSGAFDSNNDNLTFCWEQKDLGPPQTLGSSDNGSSPLFRSLPPSASGVRYFPRLADWAANVPTPTEVLPTTNRTMHFDLTVRDNHFNGGGYSSAGVTVQVVNTGNAFRVLSQNFGASWSAGGTRTVTWDVAGTTGNGINTSTVRLSFSTDGGLSYPFDLGTTANDGSHDITVPNFSTTTGRVKVQATNHNFFDINDGNISILAGNLKGAGFATKGSPVLRPNRAIQFDYSVVNQDGNAVGPTHLNFYISINPNPVVTGSLMGSTGVPPLAGNQTFQSSAVLNLPSHMATWIWNSDGTYYVGMKVDGKDDVNEVNELDNFNQGYGIDLQEITVTNVADDVYEENDLRQNASTVLLNAPGVWLSSKGGKGVQHDTDYYRFTVPPQSTKLAHIQVEMTYDNSAGNTVAVLEIPPVYFPGPGSFGTNGQVLLDYYGSPGDYNVYVAGDYGISANAYDLRWTVGPDLRGPRVTAVTATDGGDAIEQNERLITPVPGLKVEFNEPLTKATAEAPANWQLMRGGSDITGQITKISYTEQVIQFQPTRYFVTLDLATPQDNNVFELRALPGITDVDGTPLDGNGDNTSGDPFIRDFRIFDPNSPGAEQGIAQIKGGNQRRPQVALNGSYVAVWESYGQEGDSAAESNIYARRYDDAGQPLAPEFRVNTFTTGEQSRPAVASDGKGNFIVTWQSLGQDGDGYGVYFRQFKADGSADIEYRANGLGTVGNQQNPAVAMNASGQFVLAYETNRVAANGYDIVINDGFFHSPFNQFTTGDQTQPAIAMDATGNYVITWQSAGQDGSGTGIYARAYGAGWTSNELPVNETTVANQSDASVAIDRGNGNAVITWTSQNQDGSGDGVYARRFKGANSFFGFAPNGAEFRVNQATAGDQNGSTASMDADGDTVITWQSAGQDGSGTGVYARRYSPTGVAQGNEILANAYTTSDQGSPAVAVDADGDYFVVWQSAGQDGSGDGVYGRTYSVPQPEVTGTFAGVTAPGTAPYTLSVTITDNLGVNVGTLGTGDVRVTGPNGFNTLATFVGVDNNTNGTPRVATYKFDPPGGSWNPVDNGLYSLLVEPNQIGDQSGNFAAAGIVGAIAVTVGGDYLVSTTADSGFGSLRQAISNANAAPGMQTITFEPTVFNSAQTITLTAGEIAITDAVTIQGPGSALVAVSGNNASRIFNLQAAAKGTAVTIDGLTLTGGKTSGPGGAIVADDESLTVRNCVLTGNQAAGGGAINTRPAFGKGGDFLLEDSTVSANTAGAGGGGLVTGGTGTSIVIRRSTISGNSAAGAGGGAAVFGYGTTLFEGCAITGNVAGNGGGGLFLIGYNAVSNTVRNCTISGNSAQVVGGGVFVHRANVAMVFQNSTVTGNTVTTTASYGGGGIGATGYSSYYSFIDSKFSLQSCVVGGNSSSGNANHDLFNEFTGGVDAKFSAIGTKAGVSDFGADAATLALLGANCKLGPLAHNGGQTQTHALLPGSPCIDAGSNPAGLVNDQRGAGFPRVVGKAADIGAFELPLQPLSLVVNTTADVVDAGDGKTSLREAIIAANGSTLAVVDVITFDPTVFNSAATITLTAGELVITDSLTVNGPGPGVVTVSGNSASRVFRADGPGTINVTLAGMTITKGKTTANDFGAGVYSAGENLTLQQCVITGNSAAYVGGVYVYAGASLTVIDCQVTNNTATAHIGGLSASGGVTIVRSTISGNSAAGQIGGIYTAKSLLLLDSTVSANSAGLNAGGILVVDRAPGPFIIRNSTVSGNFANGDGGGIVLGYYSPGYAFDSTLIVQNSTITNNSTASGKGGGIALYKGSGSIEIESSIVSGNKAAAHADISSSKAVTLKTSAVGDASGFTFADLGGNLAVGVDLKLTPLANNGGPTFTHAIAYNSPAVNKGTNPAGLITDQRGAGFGRTVNGADIGAFEMQSFPPPTVSSLVVNGGASQRSTVTSLKVTFDQPVALPANPADAFQLRRQSDNAVVTLSAAVSGNSVTLTFTGGAINGSSLADGRYTLTAFASKVSGPGGPLDGNLDGNGGDDYVFSASPPTGIFRFFGDNDGDGDVDAQDYGAFRGAFGGTNPAFDFDGDGDVDAADFGQFRQRFGSAV